MGLSDALDDIGKGIKGAAEANLDVGNVYGHTLGPALSAVGRDVVAPVYQHVLKPALEVAAYAGNVTREALATDILMATGNGDPLSQSSWARENQVARQTSLGEVIGYTGARTSRGLGAITGIDPQIINDVSPLGFFGATDFATADGFDFNNPEDTKAFHKGAAKFWTGSTDAVADMFVDPTIGLGKVAKAARIGYVTQPLRLGQDVEANTTRLDHILGAADGSSEANQRLAAVTERYMGTAEAPIGIDRRRAMLLRDPALNHNPAIPEFLARADSDTEFRLRMRVAMNPNDLNIRMLTQNSQIAAQDLRNAQDKVVHSLTDALGNSGMTIGEAIKWGDPDAIARAEAQMKGTDATFLGLKNSLLNSIAEHDTALLAHQVVDDPILNIPRISLGNKIGDAYRESKLGGVGNEWYVYQPTRYSAVRVLRSAVTERPGNIDHDDPNSAIRNITNLFDRAGHGLGAGVPQEIRDLHIGRVNTAATTRNSAALQRAIRDAEQAVVNHNSALLGIEPKVAEALYQGFASRRSNTIQTLIATRQGRGVEDRPLDAAGQPVGDAKPPEAAFSGAKVGPDPNSIAAMEKNKGLVHASEQDKRIFADQIAAADNVLESHPLSLAQMTNSTPLMDLDVMTRFMQREKYALKEHPDDVVDAFSGKFAERYLTQGGALSTGADIGRELLTTFNRVWKPAQLLRFGWPVRVLLDEALRTIAINGVLAQGAMSLESLGNAAQHGVFRYRIKDMATRGQRKLAQTQLPEYRAKFKEGVERASTVDQLAALTHIQGQMAVEHARTRGELEQVLSEAPGRAIYYTGPPNARLAGSPRGTLFHLDPGGDEAPLDTITHTRRLDDSDPTKIHTARHGDADLGVAYLRDTIRPGQFQDLLAMSKAELRNHITADLNGAPSAFSRGVLRDEQGNPIVVYHGTNRVYDNPSDEHATTTGWFGTGHYYTESPEHANEFPGELGNAASWRTVQEPGDASHIRMAHLSMRKVWDWDEHEVPANDVDRIGRRLGFPAGYFGDRPMTLDAMYARARLTYGPSDRWGVDLPNIYHEDFNAVITPYLKGQGFDGIRHVDQVSPTGEHRPVTSYTVFDASNIRSPHETPPADAPTTPSPVRGAKVRLPLNYTQADLLSLYGVAKARAAGLHSIERTGNSILNIDATAVRRLHPDEQQLVDKLGQMSEESSHLAALHTQLTGKRDSLTEWAEDQAHAYEGLISRAAKPSATKMGRGDRPLPFSGRSTLTAGHFTVDMNDALGGHHGPMWADLLSAKSTTRAQQNATEQSLSKMQVVGGTTTTMTAEIPHDIPVDRQKLLKVTYDQGWERAVNDQIGSDAMHRRILQGEDDDTILQWMRNTPAGAEYLRKAPEARQQRLEEWVRMTRTHINNYLPSPELKELALQGRADASDLREYARSRGLTDAQLPVIHAQSLDLLRADSAMMHTISRVVDKAYQTLGTAPTDTLNRQPYFASVYNKERQRRFEQAVRGMDPTEKVSDDLVNTIEQKSRETALREVRRTLYDLTQESNLAHTTRFMLPFYSAWQEAMSVWGRLFMEDPSRLTRVMAVWNAPQRSGDTYTDADGNKFYVTPVPKFLRGHFNIPETGIGMPVHVMRDLVFQGNQFWNPGFGPPVMVPLGEIERHMPTTEQFLKPLMPYGPGEGISSQLLPSAYKSDLAKNQGSNSEAYAKGLFRNFQDVYTDNRLGKNDLDEQGMYNEAKRRTDSLFTLKTVTALGLPFAANIRGPYQYYIDKWRTMQEAQRTNPTAFGTDADGKPVTAQDEFIKEEGEDYYVFTLAASKSNIGGIAPTQEGLSGFDKYKDLVAQMPEMGSLIVGDTSGDYSPAVAEWMQNNQIGPGNTQTLRTLRDPKAALTDAEVSRGWTLYRQVATAVDTALHDRGLLSLRAKGASDIAAKRTALVNKLKADYPAWAQEFGTFDRSKEDRRVAFMNTLVDDPRTQGREGFGTLRSYLATRQLLVAELAKRKAGGGSNDLQARQNAGLADAWTAYVNRLRQSDTAFADLQTRWLSGDDLKTGGDSQ